MGDHHRNAMNVLPHRELREVNDVRHLPMVDLKMDGQNLDDRLMDDCLTDDQNLMMDGHYLRDHLKNQRLNDQRHLPDRHCHQLNETMNCRAMKIHRVMTTRRHDLNLGATNHRAKMMNLNGHLNVLNLDVTMNYLQALLLLENFGESDRYLIVVLVFPSLE